MGNTIKWRSHLGVLLGNSREDTHAWYENIFLLTTQTPNLKDKKDKILKTKGLSFIDFCTHN